MLSSGNHNPEILFLTLYQGPGIPGGWNGGGQTQSNPDWYAQNILLYLFAELTECWTHKPFRQRDERRRRQEEKADVKRHRDQDGREDADYELRMAREWDSQSSMHRDRRRSFNAGPQSEPPVAFPGTNGNPGGYPAHSSVGSGYAPYPGYNSAAPVAYSTSASSGGHSRKASANGGYSDLAAQFNDLTVDRKKIYEERERKSSRSRRYSTNESSYERPRTTSGTYDAARNAYPAAPGPYPGASSYGSMNPPPNASGYPGSAYAPSPNMRSGEIPYGTSVPSGYPGSNASSSPYPSPAQNPANIARSTTPFGGPGPQVYPRGHILEGQPIGPRSRPPSRAASPNPGMFFACIR